MIIDAAGLLAAAAIKTKKIAVRGVSLMIRELTLDGRQAFIDGLKDGQKNAAAAVILHGVVCPKTKQPILSQEQADEIAAGSGAFAQDVTQEILKFSGLSGESKND